MNVYTISGLGADESVFDDLTICTIPHHLEWIDPKEGENIADYAQRMAQKIDVSQPFALIGLSFGGLIAIDNVLWYGKVADSQIDDNRTKKIRALNEKIHQDERVTISMVPIGDGLTLARRKG